MKLATAIVLLVAALVLLLASHLHDEARRYDVVVAGAGAGGSQESTGSTEIAGYLVDHKTGRVWRLTGIGQKPTVVVSCSQMGGDTKFAETERGCELVGPSEKKP